MQNILLFLLPVSSVLCRILCCSWFGFSCISLGILGVFCIRAGQGGGGGLVGCVVDLLLSLLLNSCCSFSSMHSLCLGVEY